MVTHYAEQSAEALRRGRSADLVLADFERLGLALQNNINRIAAAETLELRQGVRSTQMQEVANHLFSLETRLINQEARATLVLYPTKNKNLVDISPWDFCSVQADAPSGETGLYSAGVLSDSLASVASLSGTKVSAQTFRSLCLSLEQLAHHAAPTQVLDSIFYSTGPINTTAWLRSQRRIARLVHKNFELNLVESGALKVGQSPAHTANVGAQYRGDLLNINATSRLFFTHQRLLEQFSQTLVPAAGRTYGEIVTEMGKVLDAQVPRLIKGAEFSER